MDTSSSRTCLNNHTVRIAIVDSSAFSEIMLGLLEIETYIPKPALHNNPNYGIVKRKSNANAFMHLFPCTKVGAAGGQLPPAPSLPAPMKQPIFK